MCVCVCYVKCYSFIKICGLVSDICKFKDHEVMIHVAHAVVWAKYAIPREEYRRGAYLPFLGCEFVGG